MKKNKQVCSNISMYVPKSFFWIYTGSLSWKEIVNICTKWEKVKKKKRKKVVLEKMLAFFSFSPLKAAKFFWSYVLQESVAVNFDVPSSVVRA